jgi:hypothetical protein
LHTILSIYGFKTEINEKEKNLQYEIERYERKCKGIEKEIITTRGEFRRRSVLSRSIKKEEQNMLNLKKRENKENEFYKQTIIDSQSIEYDRSLYIIRNKDYKRGNKIENYFYNILYSLICDTFENKCIHCESKTELTLDHFAIPKNEGGNFVLMNKNDSSIKINVILLCKYCNSSKGEKNYLIYFTEKEIVNILHYHTILVKEILKNEKTMREIKRWYSGK